MMESTFDVNGREFKVEFSLLGHEKYSYDGRVLRKRWSFKFNDRLAFDIDGENIEIVVSLSRKSWSIQAYKNNELLVKELFPKIKQRLEKRHNRKPMTKGGMLKNVVLWSVITIVLLAVIERLKQP